LNLDLFLTFKFVRIVEDLNELKATWKIFVLDPNTTFTSRQNFFQISDSRKVIQGFSHKALISCFICCTYNWLPIIPDLVV